VSGMSGDDLSFRAIGIGISPSNGYCATLPKPAIDMLKSNSESSAATVRMMNRQW